MGERSRLETPADVAARARRRGGGRGTAGSASPRPTTRSPTSASRPSPSWWRSAWTSSTAGSPPHPPARPRPCPPPAWAHRGARRPPPPPGAPAPEPAPVVVAPWTALALRVPSRDDVRARSVHLEVGQTIDRDALVEILLAAGYAKVPPAEERGGAA